MDLVLSENTIILTKAVMNTPLVNRAELKPNVITVAALCAPLILESITKKYSHDLMSINQNPKRLQSRLRVVISSYIWGSRC